MHQLIAVKAKLQFYIKAFTYLFQIFLADVLPFYKQPLLAAPQLFTARNDGKSLYGKYTTLQCITQS